MFSKIAKALLTAAIIALPFSCEDLGAFMVDCNECYELKPEKIDVLLKFTINTENPKVYFEIYNGLPDNGTLLYTGYSTTKENVLILDPDNYYSIKAFYSSKGREVIVVDGTNLKLKYDKTSCLSPCYVIVGDKLDARLRY